MNSIELPVDHIDIWIVKDENIHEALNKLLVRYLGINESLLQLKKSKYGKPYISGEYFEKLFFNISHTQGFSVIAFYAGSEIGVDVEVNQHLPEEASIGDMIFHEKEKIIYSNLSAEKRSEYFYKVWVYKEAYLKAIGSGLSEDPRKYSLCSSLHQESRVDIDGIRIKEVEIDGGCIGAIAYHRNESDLDPKFLIHDF